jgi:hypothetical protein
MPYGRSFGRGGGFRGSYAAWPYIGRGRGGLPRCGYFFNSPANNMPANAYEFPTARGNELNALKNAASALKVRLEQIQTRISELEQK